MSFVGLSLCLAAPARAGDTAIQPVAPDLGRPVDFYQDVYPILEAKCLACHNVTKKEGDLVLERVEALLQGGASGPALVPGKPDESLLVSLSSRAGEPAMPPLPNPAQARPLTPRELGILRKWIEEGAAKGNPPPASALHWLPVPESVRSIQALALDPSQRYLAAGRANRVVLFDLLARRELAQLTDPALLSLQHDGTPMYGPGVAHRDYVHAVAFSPDGNLLASAGYREVKLWERVRETRLAEWTADQPITALAVSQDGALAATGHADGSIRLWDLATGSAGKVLTGHAGAVRGVAFTSDGSSLLTGGDDKTLRRWNVADGVAGAVAPTDAEITALAVTYDDALILTGHADHKLRVWDPQQASRGRQSPDDPAPPAGPTPAEQPALTLLRELTGHNQPITGLVAVPGVDEVLSASRDGMVRQWNVKEGKETRTFKLDAPVLGVSTTSDGKRIAAGGENGIARVWNREDGKQLAEVRGDPALAHDVQRLADDLTVASSRASLAENAMQEAEKELKSREDALGKLVDQIKEGAAKKLRDEAATKLTEAEGKAAEAAKQLAEQPEDEGRKKAREEADKAVAAARDVLAKAEQAAQQLERSRRLAEESSARGKAAAETAKADHEAAKAFAQAVEKQLNQTKDAAGKSAAACRAALLSGDGLQLTTLGDAPRADVWNAANGKSLEWIALGGQVSFAAFTSNGTLVTASDKTLTVRDLAPAWKLIARLGPKADNPLDVSESRFADRVIAIAFSPDGTKLLTGGGVPSRGGELLLWDVASRQVVHDFPDAHSDTVFDVAFSRDGSLIVSGAADKFVKLFEAGTGKLVRGFEGHTAHVMAVGLKGDRSTIVSGGADNAIKLWNAETGEQRRTITAFGKQVTAADFVGVSDNLVAAGGDKTVRLFTAGNGNNVRTFGGPADYVYAALATPDQELVIAAGEDGVVRVWNGKDGSELMKFEPPALAPADTPAN